MMINNKAKEYSSNAMNRVCKDKKTERNIAEQWIPTRSFET
jgi:hypothetical protein